MKSNSRRTSKYTEQRIGYYCLVSGTIAVKYDIVSKSIAIGIVSMKTANRVFVRALVLVYMSIPVRFDNTVDRTFPPCCFPHPLIFLFFFSSSYV